MPLMGQPLSLAWAPCSDLLLHTIGPWQEGSGLTPPSAVSPRDSDCFIATTTGSSWTSEILQVRHSEAKPDSRDGHPPSGL